MLELFPITTQVKNDRLVVGGCDIVSLASEFGTPLYIYDEATIRGKCREYRAEFADRYPNSLIVYACKAFINRALARLFNEEGLGLDVVSGGELAVVQSIQFPADKIYFNGNNKSAQELEMALDVGVGRIVADNFYELSLIEDIAKNNGVHAAIMLRLSPGVDPHTHAHLATGASDSKFGFPMEQAAEAVRKTLASPSLDLLGVHFHIGSQIFEFTPYRQAIDIVLDFTAEMSGKHSFSLKELSIGGGLGIAYTRDSSSPKASDFAEFITTAVTKKCKTTSTQPPRLIIEPGRSIVGQAGIAVYCAGATKEIEGVRKYVSVDGGMSDNIRQALYGARYEAVIANRMSDGNVEQVTISGKLCESGDILIRDIALPEVRAGDILAVPCCGAYCLAMASNYNGALKPAIVLVNEGKPHIIRRRETYEDLMRCDMD